MKHYQSTHQVHCISSEPFWDKRDFVESQVSIIFDFQRKSKSNFRVSAKYSALKHHTSKLTVLFGVLATNVVGVIVAVISSITGGIGGEATSALTALTGANGSSDRDPPKPSFEGISAFFEFQNHDAKIRFQLIWFRIRSWRGWLFFWFLNWF